MGDSQSVILLDFDGVLIDSVDECVVTAYNQYTGSLCRSLSDLPAAYVPLMRRNRSRARKAGEFKRLAGWCLEQVRLGNHEAQLSEEQFRELYDGSESFPELGKEFFSFRQRLVALNMESWCELNPPMQPIWEWLVSHPAARFTILTYKNLAAVEAICRHYGLELRKEDVFASDDGTTKAENLERIIKKHGESKQYHFIDDSIDNLIEIREIEHRSNLSLYWASWGFQIEGDGARAEREKFQVLSQTGAIRLFEQIYSPAKPR